MDRSTTPTGPTRLTEKQNKEVFENEIKRKEGRFTAFFSSKEKFAFHTGMFSAKSCRLIVSDRTMREDSKQAGKTTDSDASFSTNEQKRFYFSSQSSA